ncbi:IS3 family transposase [Butyricicoccus sp.]|uniref:IS3 family transposase n=1 Tax=Butyricicoccus sp. TaxID=2049021 RepID=UPI003736C6DA
MAQRQRRHSVLCLDTEINISKEEIDRRFYQSLNQLKQSLFSYINGFCNSLRRHSYNRVLSSIQRENLFFS